MAPTRAQRPGPAALPPRLLVPIVLLATVLVGIALSLLPSTSSSLPSAKSPSGFPFAHAKHLPASALRYLPRDLQPTYWADKRNFVNRVFVKIGWAWTSLAVLTVCGLIITYSSPEERRPPAEADPAVPALELDRAVGKSKAKRGGWKGLVKRYLIVTLGWILTTQSFPFLYSAPPLSDRLLLLTGAKCVAALGDVAAVSPVPTSPILGPGKNGEDAGSVGKPEWGLVRPGEVELPREYCVRIWGRRSPSTDKKLARQHKPYWYGGTDLSGHAFLLSLGVLLLVDSLRTLLAAPLSLPPSSPPAAAGPTTPGGRRPTPAVVLVALIVTSFLTVLWWWMLLMTSLHFHGPLEKLLGVGSALAWWAVADGLTS